MLKDRYKFKADYANMAIVCAHLKAVQERAVTTPYNRPEGKSLELLLCSILKPMAKRLDIQLWEYSSEVKFNMKRDEALAFHCAYKYNWLPYSETGQQIFETIDKVV